MRRLLWASFALVPALGLGVAISPAAGATSAHARATADVPGRTTGGPAAAARAALKNLTLVNRPVPGHTVRSASQTTADSFNWSGYADSNSSGNLYSKVFAKWKEPAITCGQEDQMAVFFVGIDGWTSTSGEQGGTLAQCYQGAAHYYTWWEVSPVGITMVGTTVKPGDKMAASVTRTGTSYVIKVTDSTTTANSFSTTQTCAKTTCVDSSAEWIAEAPNGARGLYPLPDFKSWGVASASVASGTKTGTISTFPHVQITMLDSSEAYPLASPSALNTSGNSLSVTWNNSY